MEALDAIEAQLTEAAELHLTGALTEGLYVVAVRGALAALPKPAAPKHIAVLKRLKQWKDDELIPLEVYNVLCTSVTTASRGPTAGAASSGSTAEQRPVKRPAPATATQAAPTPKKRKAAALPGGQQSLFAVMPEAKKLKTTAHELRAQREAAGRGEDYDVEVEEMAKFKSEKLKAEPAPPVVKKYSCTKCPRTFSTAIGLNSHTTWAHSADTKPKEFFKPQPEVLPTPVEVNFAVDAHGILSVGLTLDGLTLEEIRAEDAAACAAQAARERQRNLEAVRRLRIREAEQEAEKGEHRCGSARRQSYTPKEKLRILELWDNIRADPLIKKKVETFEKDKRAKGTPYSTVKVGWDPPEARAKISAAAGKEHAGTLLRIDTNSRKVGKFAAMEAELFARFKARRARGRKVSGRWLTAMGRQLMLALDPDRAASFKGGKSWRRRFALRFKIGLRRKTNAKNKTWADTEPILIRYFKALRRRLQLEDDDVAAETWDEEEPEPDDVNAQLEEDDGREVVEEALDSEDDGDDDDLLVTLRAVVPDGFKVASAPPAEQLVFKSAQAQQLVGRSLLFNWAAVGWCKGEITSPNTDGRVKMKIGNEMKTVNFRAEYEDETEAKHVLSLDNYGEGALAEDGKWVLLERQ
jgi:hypothetical protein